MSNTQHLICKMKKEMGMGNRIKHLMSFLQYFNSPEEIFLIWPNTGWVSDSFNNLFEFDKTTTIKELNNSIVDANIQPSYPTSWRLYVAPDYNIDIENDDPFDKDTKRIDFLYNKTPQEIIDIYRPIFARIKPSKQVKEIIETTEINENMIAVQIRDNSDWIKNGRTPYLEQFIEKMKKYPKDTKFFISVMNETISNKLKDLFPNQIVELPNKEYHSMKYAVADMFLLSIPKKALCSCGSTFYEVSWWIGGCNADVTVIGDYKNWRMPSKGKIVRHIFYYKK